MLKFGTRLPIRGNGAKEVTCRRATSIGASKVGIERHLLFHGHLKRRSEMTFHLHKTTSRYVIGYQSHCLPLFHSFQASPLVFAVRRTYVTSPKRVIFSGIQPTGVPHIGNYLGALQQWVRLQNEEPSTTKLVFSIVDLHALTVQQDASRLRRWKRETLAALLAVGLDPRRCTIFYQSDV